VLCARYSASSGVNLTGSPDDLSNLARDLELGRLATVELAERQPHPYDLALRIIDVRDSDGPLRLKIEDEALVVTGARAACDLLSKNIAFFVSDSSPTDPRAHLHVEWHEGNKWIAEDSELLVVAFGEL
jgi:hypothetical protein